MVEQAEFQLVPVKRHLKACCVSSRVSRVPSPINHCPQTEIEQHGQIEPAFRGSDVGEVSCPHLIRSGDSLDLKEWHLSYCN